MGLVWKVGILDRKVAAESAAQYKDFPPAIVLNIHRFYLQQKYSDINVTLKQI